MKIVFLILAILIASECLGTDPIDNTTSSVANATAPIVINTQNTTTVDHQKVNVSQPTPTPTDVPPVIEAEIKEATFNLDGSNEFQGNFDKAPAAATPSTQKGQKLVDPALDLAVETQREAEIEQEKHKEELADEQSKIRPWIVEEMQNSEQQIDGIVTESFHFILDSQADYKFRWNPPRTQILSINVLVFQILDNGQIMLQHDLEEGEFIEIASREEGHNVFNTLGHIYVSKLFRINFDTDFKYFRFTSHMPKSVYVVVDLEKTHEVIPQDSIARDHHFQLPLEKLKVIEEEVESGEKIREHTYKYEWGFLDNQYAHDSRLLGLTGFELVVIIGAALAQLYFIKNLLDNRAVV